MSAIDLEKMINENTRNGVQSNGALIMAQIFAKIEESSGPATVLLILSGNHKPPNKPPMLGDVLLDGFDVGDNFTYLWNYACYPAPPHFLRKTYITNSRDAMKKQSKALRSAGHVVYTCSTNMEFDYED